MFASATSGDRPNNSKFSSCSIGNISNVLDAIEENKKRNCFTKSEGAFCGNKIVEAGEECDCGYNDLECNDKCCYPRVVGIQDKVYNATARGCTRRYGTECRYYKGYFFLFSSFLFLKFIVLVKGLAAVVRRVGLYQLMNKRCVKRNRIVLLHQNVMELRRSVHYQNHDPIKLGAIMTRNYVLKGNVLGLFVWNGI